MSAVATPTVDLNVSESAAEEIKKFFEGEDDLTETAGLRVRVVPGGCSGFQYSLNIEEDSRQGDFLIERHGIRLFVDMFSAQYLNGVTIDYTSNMMGAGFTFAQIKETFARCDEVIVLQLDGWRESEGVQAEMALARELGRRVDYLTPEGE